MNRVVQLDLLNYMFVVRVWARQGGLIDMGGNHPSVHDRLHYLLQTAQGAYHTRAAAASLRQLLAGAAPRLTSVRLLAEMAVYMYTMTITMNASGCCACVESVECAEGSA